MPSGGKANMLIALTRLMMTLLHLLVAKRFVSLCYVPLATVLPLSIGPCYGHKYTSTETLFCYNKNGPGSSCKGENHFNSFSFVSGSLQIKGNWQIHL